MEQDHMLPEHPPSYSQSHDPQTLSFPSVPTADLPPIHHERILPPLPSAPADPRFRPEPASESQYVWPSSNPLTAYYQPGPSKLSPTNQAMDSPNNMDMDIDRGRRGGSVLSIDDPDVRIAAEALGDLRADFIQSPPPTHASLPGMSTTSQGEAQHPEPLLSLLTESHPIIGTAIGGSLSAYSASKNYSPRFKSGAEYVERRFTPIVNTVGSVNRITGIEGGVRWFLGGRRSSHQNPSDLEEGSNKRRKVDNREIDSNVPLDPYAVSRQEPQHRQRAPSQASTAESLPAYDEHRSPSYEISQQALVPAQTDEPMSPGSTWGSRLVLSTSGLSVAMSEESLRSLKYCLGWLRWANEHIGKVIEALKSALEQYDQGSDSSTSGAITGGWTYPNQREQSNGQLIVRSDAERSALNAKIAELKTDVLKTLKQVVDIVSKYAGGALPENARVLVRRHLTSLPQRFRLASAHSGTAANGGDKEVTEGANRVMVLAKEGLDMMAQVSGVLDGTIVSAEEWCERLGRKKQEEQQFQGGMAVDGEKAPLPPIQMDGNGYIGGNPDVKMG